MMIGVSLDKKIVITGIFISAKKACDFDDNLPINFECEGGGRQNNGVTVAHILSELFCPED
jgi:hypothetical protein